MWAADASGRPLGRSFKVKLWPTLVFLRDGREIERLEALQKINPAIRDEEITFFRDQLAQGKAAINQASLQLQALRLIVNT